MADPDDEPSAGSAAPPAPDADALVREIRHAAMLCAQDEDVERQPHVEVAQDWLDRVAITLGRSADLIEQQARELADTRAALGAIDVRGPDGDGLVWIVCTMPNGDSGAVSVSSQRIAAGVFVAWRQAAQKAIDAAIDAALREPK